jgi:hypothetical protein
MSSLNLLDCLVLCIDDLSSFKLFVLYDTKKNIYELRGKNYVLVSDDSESESVLYSDSDSDLEKESNNIEFLPFSFKSKKSKHLIEFIEFIISLNSCEFTVYNYNNFPSNSNKITFDFLENHQQNKREIFCYEKENFDKEMCKKLLKMIKNIYNNY